MGRFTDQHPLQPLQSNKSSSAKNYFNSIKQKIFVIPTNKVNVVRPRRDHASDLHSSLNVAKPAPAINPTGTTSIPSESPHHQPPTSTVQPKPAVEAATQQPPPLSTNKVLSPATKSWQKNLKAGVHEAKSTQPPQPKHSSASTSAPAQVTTSSSLLKNDEEQLPAFIRQLSITLSARLLEEGELTDVEEGEITDLEEGETGVSEDMQSKLLTAACRQQQTSQNAATATTAESCNPTQSVKAANVFSGASTDAKPSTSATTCTHSHRQHSTSLNGSTTFNTSVLSHNEGTRQVATSTAPRNKSKQHTVSRHVDTKHQQENRGFGGKVATLLRKASHSICKGTTATTTTHKPHKSSIKRRICSKDKHPPVLLLFESIKAEANALKQQLKKLTLAASQLDEALVLPVAVQEPSTDGSCNHKPPTTTATKPTAIAGVGGDSGKSTSSNTSKHQEELNRQVSAMAKQLQALNSCISSVQNIQMLSPASIPDAGGMTYVVFDTNVLIDKLPTVQRCWNLIKEADERDIALLMPQEVIRELDSLKGNTIFKRQTAIDARAAIRFLQEATRNVHYRGQRQLELLHPDMKRYHDDSILDCLILFQRAGADIIFCTMDKNFEVRVASEGILVIQPHYLVDHVAGIIARLEDMPRQPVYDDNADTFVLRHQQQQGGGGGSGDVLNVVGDKRYELENKKVGGGMGSGGGHSTSVHQQKPLHAINSSSTSSKAVRVPEQQAATSGGGCDSGCVLSNSFTGNSNGCNTVLEKLRRTSTSSSCGSHSHENENAAPHEPFVMEFIGRGSR